MDDIDITSNIKKYMENKAHFDHIGYGFIRKHYVPWFGKRGEIEPLLNNIEKEYSKIYEENSDLRELLSMYVAFGEAMAKDCTVQNAYPDGMGVKLNETKMRERARQLGIESRRI